MSDTPSPEEIAEARLYAGVLRRANEMLVDNDGMKIGDAVKEAMRIEGVQTLPAHIEEAMLIALFKIQTGSIGLFGGPKQ